MYRSTLFLPLPTHIEILVVRVQAPTLYPLFTSDFEWEYTSEGADKAIAGRRHALLWRAANTKTCSSPCFRDGEVRCVLCATRDRAHTKRDEALFISIHYF